MERWIRTLLGAALALGLGLGCTTPLERHWGASFRAHNEAMIVDPHAAEQHEGLDPATGELVMKKYTERQREAREEPSSVFLIQQ